MKPENVENYNEVDRESHIAHTALALFGFGVAAITVAGVKAGELLRSLTSTGRASNNVDVMPHAAVNPAETQPGSNLDIAGNS